MNVKIRAISGICIGSGRDLMPGDTAEVDANLAYRLIQRGKVVEVKPGEDKKNAGGNDESGNDDKGKGKGKGKK